MRNIKDGVVDNNIYTYSARLESGRIRISELQNGEYTNSYTIDANLVCKLLKTKQYSSSVELLTLITIADMWEQGKVEVDIKGKEMNVKFL